MNSDKNLSSKDQKELEHLNSLRKCINQVLNLLQEFNDESIDRALLKILSFYHDHIHRAALQHLEMIEIILGVRLSVECSRLDINILIAVGRRIDNKILAVLEMQCSLLEKRSAHADS